MARTPLLGPRVLRNFLLLYGSTLFSGLGWGMVLPTIPVLAASFDISLGAAAQTVTVWATGRFVGTPVSGILLDRIGPRVMMVAGAAATSVAAIGAFMSPGFGWLLIALFVVGMVEPSWNLGREVAGIDLAAQNQRGRVMSGFHGVHSAGMTLGPLAGGFLTVSAGFRYVFVAYALVAALAALCGLAVDRPSGAGMPRPSARNTVRRFGLGYWTGRIVALYREVAPPFRRTYAVLVAATCASLMCRLTLQSMLPLYAGGHLGFSPVEVGALFSISGVVVFFMIVPAGFVLDKVGRKWATVPSNLIPAIVFLIIPLADTFLQLAVLLSLMGIANGLSLGCLATTTYDVVPQHARGRLQAMRRTIADFVGLGAPAGGGMLANAFHPGIPFLALTPVLWVSALLLAFAARETLER
ncbi:MAG: MFS transporter [Deltaproteobacteria bacterium]|nr:MFS transporter [Deltaproteobacteria bacterium]